MIFSPTRALKEHKKSSSFEKNEEKIANIVTKLIRVFDKEVSRIGNAECESSSRAFLSCMARHALDDFDHETRRIDAREAISTARSKLKSYLQAGVEREARLISDRVDSEKRSRDEEASRQKAKLLAVAVVPRLVKDAQKSKKIGEPDHDIDGILHPSHFFLRNQLKPKTPNKLTSKPQQSSSAVQRPVIPPKKSPFALKGLERVLGEQEVGRKVDEFFNGELLHVDPVRRYLRVPNAQQNEKKCVRLEAKTANVQESLARTAKTSEKKSSSSHSDPPKASRPAGKVASASAAKPKTKPSSSSNSKSAKFSLKKK